MFPYCFLYFLKYFGNNYEVYGSIFLPNFRSSINHLKSIGIDQELWINHFGIIWTPKIPYETLKEPEKQQITLFVSPIGALLEPYFSSFWALLVPEFEPYFDCENETQMVQDGVKVLPEQFKIDQQHVNKSLNTSLIFN